MSIEKIEKKYANVLGFAKGNSSDSHYYFMDIVQKIRKSGANGSSLGILDRIGDYYAEIAPIVRASEIENRWKPGRRSEEPDHSSKYAQQDKDRRKEEQARGRRESDQRRDSFSITKQEYQRHEGTEEFLASMIYSLTAPKKIEKFAQSFFNKKEMSNLKLVGSYYTGPFCGNNTLFDTLLILDQSGKKFAPQIASTIERIIGDRVMSQALDVRSLAMEASRMYYLSGKAELNKYMNRLAKSNKELYQEIQTDDPKSLLVYGGDAKNPTTFLDRLNALRVSAKKALSLVDAQGKPIKPLQKKINEERLPRPSKSVEDLISEEKLAKSAR